MRKFTLSLTLSVGLALVGCATLAPLTPSPETVSPQTRPAYEPGDLVLNLRIGDSRMLQAAGDPISVYDASDVSKLVITPFVKLGDAFVPMSVTGTPTTEQAADRFTIVPTDPHQRRFILKNLPPNRTYRFQATAFDASGKQISKDEGSVSEVTFTQFAYAPMANIQLCLLDKPFVGTAKAQFSFPDGLNGTDTVLVELFKKGPPEVKVAGPFPIPASQLQGGRALVLGGLAPHTTYVLKAEARSADDEVLTTASAEWDVEDDQQLLTKTLEVSFGPMVTTVSGGDLGFTDNVPLAQARYVSPFGMVLGADGIVYVADPGGPRIRRLDLSGNVTTLATLSSAPETLSQDASGNLFAVSYLKRSLYKITPTGSPSLYGGNGTTSGPDALTNPHGVCVDPQNNVYVTQDNVIWKYTAQGQRTSFATVPTPNASLYGLLSDSLGNIYAADAGTGRIHKISPAGVVETFAGVATKGILDGPVSTAQLTTPVALARSGDTLYFSDGACVRQIKDGVVTTLAGAPFNPEVPYRDGKASEARFGPIIGGLVVLPDGSLLLSDTNNNRIRKLTLPPQATN